MAVVCAPKVGPVIYSQWLPHYVLAVGALDMSEGRRYRIDHPQANAKRIVEYSE